MAEKSAIFGLFAGGNAGEVFKKLGENAQKTSHETASLAMAVEDASLRMQVAGDKEQASLAKVGIAQAKLDEMRTAGTASGSALMAQEERLAAAQRGSAVATLENSRATKALAVSEAEANAEAQHLHKNLSGAGAGLKGLGSKLGGLGPVGIGLAVGAGVFEVGKAVIKTADSFEV